MFSRVAWAVLLACLTTTAVMSEHAVVDSVYYSTDGFEITELDRLMYLRDAPPEAGGGIGSRARNLQALSDLYAIKILVDDASKLGLLTEEERRWLAEYAIDLELTRRYLKQSVDEQLAATDWSAEARERYLATPEDFQLPESVSVRTLLIRTEDRSEAEAMEIAADLLRQAQEPDTDFTELVSDYTEDESAAGNGGLMSNVVRGQTVPPFEEAAFALRTSGEFSEPVVSQFGVHLIQLLEYTPAEQLSYEEAEQRIIKELKPIRAAQYREALQNEARERKPEGFVQHTDALDELMSRTSDGALGPKFSIDPEY